MGGFFSTDTLSEFKVSLLDNEIPDMDAAMLQLVNNFGRLTSIRSASRNQAKRHRIVQGAGTMYKICNDICDEIEPDPSDFDDIMIVAEMCKYRIKQSREPIDVDDWLTLWDETLRLLEKIERNVKNWKHMHYYFTMCHVLKGIKFIYKRRCCL